MIQEYGFQKKDMESGIPLKIPEGYYVLWEFTTQAGYEYVMILKDRTSGKVYCEERRKSVSIDPIRSGQFRTESADTVLAIRVTESGGVDFRCADLTIEKNEIITKSYTFVAEDWNDDDYNDMLLHITAWRTLGSGK